MRTSLALMMALVIASLGGPLRAQGTFQNLGFESPITPLVPVEPVYGFVPISNALPNWSGQLGTTPQELVLHNNYFLGTPVIALLGLGMPYWMSPIEGSYSVLLQAGTYPDQTVGVSAAISQNGLVPSATHSLQFKVLGADYEVRVGGQVIPMFELASATNYKLVGGDISSFAGQVVELRLTALAPAQHPGNWVYLDSITFSPQVIPEPGLAALLGLGGLLLLRQVWRRTCTPCSSQSPQRSL